MIEKNEYYKFLVRRQHGLMISSKGMQYTSWPYCNLLKPSRCFLMEAHSVANFTIRAFWTPVYSFCLLAKQICSSRVCNYYRLDKNAVSMSKQIMDSAPDHKS